MLNISICEDEPQAAEKLEKEIRAFCEKKDVPCSIRIFDNPILFLTAFRSDEDLIFMDIEMPDMDGIRTAGKIRALDAEVPIVIVTNMKTMALRGYEVGALDFIVKPVNAYAMELTMKKALRLIARKESHMLTVPIKYGARRVDAQDLRYVEMSGRKPVFHTAEETIASSGTLKDLEETLYRYGFRRCNNYCLVNLRYITEVQKDQIRLGQETIDISRPRKKQFLQELTDYWGGNL